MTTTVLVPADLQLKRLFEVAQEYRAKGYRVIVGPAQSELPEFLRGHDPDMIVLSDSDNAVVEVKYRRAMLGTNRLSRMAEVIEKQPGWRIELNLLPTDPEREVPLPASTNLENVRELLVRAHTADSDLALINACAALEHAFVIAAERADLELPSSSPTAALKTLYAYGLIGYDDYNKVDAAMRLRDDVVNGRERDVDASSWISTIEPIIAELLEAA